MNNYCVRGEELRKKIKEALELLVGSVKITLGPKGSNAIIANDYHSPFITNDGVTIAKNVCSDDPIVNAILNIAKESSIKTNEVVGDGTTTTLVLLKSMIDYGNELISNGYNPIRLKEEMNEYCDKLINCLDKLSIKCSKENLYNIANISANDEEIGKIVSKIYNKLGENGVIQVLESDLEETNYEILNGYSVDEGIYDSVLLNDNKSLVLDKPYIYLSLNKILYCDVISVINEVVCENKNLVFIADAFDDEMISNCALINMNGDSKIGCIRCPNYGDTRKDIMHDLEIVTNGEIDNKLGTLLSVNINKENTIFNFANNINIKERAKNIKKQISKCSGKFEKEILCDRLSKLDGGMAIINVGGITRTEMLEKKMRFDDAVCAVKSAIKGKYLIGGGVSLLKLQRFFENERDNIIVQSLSAPFKTILENENIEIKDVLEKIESSNYNLVYNVKNHKYEDIKITGVIDSYNVVSYALKNAISIASMLLTTSVLIINNDVKNKIINPEL